MTISWLNGEFTDGTLTVDAHDRGFMLGDGLFETIAVVNHRPLWLAEHLQRMKRAAAELGIPFVAGLAERGVKAVLTKSSKKSEVLRVTLSRGVASRGLGSDGAKPTLLLTLDGFPAANLFQPCRLKVSTIRRNEFAPSSRLKSLSYIDGILAAREVMGDADDALMLNMAGAVASTTIANIFLLRKTALVTPALDQGVVAGITRGVLLDNTVGVFEAKVEIRDLFMAEAVFLTNSLRFVRPVTHINGESLVTGSLEGLKDMLCTLARKQCGIDPRSLI